MASVSLSMTVAGVEDVNPENITVGSAAPGAGDIELRVDMAKFTSLKQVLLALCKMDDFIGDQNYGPSNFKVL